MLRIVQSSQFFQSIKMQNDCITVGDEGLHIWELFTPILETVSQSFEFCRENTSGVCLVSVLHPWVLDYILKARHFSPKIFKAKNASSGDLCVNDNLVGDVIRRYLRKRNNLRIRIGYCPIHRSKKPVWLLSNGSLCILLHVKALPFRGSSTRPRCPMASLKIKVSWMLPPGRLRSLIER